MSANGKRATIVTLTMNPALDITTAVDRVRPTHKLRCHDARHDRRWRRHKRGACRACARHVGRCGFPPQSERSRTT
jgi:hypothetical protein